MKEKEFDLYQLKRYFSENRLVSFYVNAKKVSLHRIKNALLYLIMAIAFLLISSFILPLLLSFEPVNSEGNIFINLMVLGIVGFIAACFLTSIVYFVGYFHTKNAISLCSRMNDQFESLKGKNFPLDEAKKLYESYTDALNSGMLDSESYGGIFEQIRRSIYDPTTRIVTTVATIITGTIALIIGLIEILYYFNATSVLGEGGILVFILILLAPIGIGLIGYGIIVLLRGGYRVVDKALP